jgi:hypothetical protein
MIQRILTVCLYKLVKAYKQAQTTLRFHHRVAATNTTLEVGVEQEEAGFCLYTHMFALAYKYEQISIPVYSLFLLSRDRQTIWYSSYYEESSRPAIEPSFRQASSIS